MANDLGKLVAALAKADEAGDTETATAISAAIKQQLMTAQSQEAPLPSLQILSNPGEYKPGSPQFQEKYGPTAGMGTVNRLRAGYGKSIYDLGRGAGQYVGAVSREDVQRSRELDAPLMDTTAGKIGYVGGMIANTAPAAMIPGANTLAGAAAIGGGVGALMPSTSTGETLTNIGLGGAGGPAGMLAGRGIAAGYRGGKALVEPFTRGGQERIAQRTLEAFAGGRDRALQAADSIANAGPMLPGVNPTTAELANNPGLAQLERILRSNPEYMTAITDQVQGNKGALLSVLDDIAGDPVKMAAAREAREKATKALYDSAKSVTVQSDPELASLLTRPSMRKAWRKAQQMAAEAGDEINETDLSGRTLHYLKMAMDDLTDNPQTSGIGGQQVGLIRDTKKALLNWIERNIPEYRQARETFAELSKPINQMEVGTALRNKFQPALADFGASSRTRAQAYAQALREGDATAARALGRSRASINDVMTPDQMRRLNEVARQLGRRATADELGRSVGSPTAQNMISQNVMRQFLGPLGLPESTIARAAESTLLQSILRPAQFAGRIGEERAMQVLARAAQNPVVAEEMLRVGVDPQTIGLLIRNQKFIAPALVSGSNALSQ